MPEYKSTLLVQSADPQEIQRADLDLLQKINESSATVDELSSSVEDLSSNLEDLQKQVDAAKALTDANALTDAKSYADSKVSKDTLTALSNGNLTLAIDAAGNKSLAQDIDNLIQDLTNVKAYVDAQDATRDTAISGKASSATQTVAKSLRTVLQDVIALQNTFFGGDTAAPAVHAQKLTGTINVSAYDDGTGKISGPNDGTSVTLDALKKSVPSSYDMVQMGVTLYHMIVNGKHPLNLTSNPRVSEAMTTDQIAEVLSTFTGSETTAKAQSSNSIDTTAL